MITSCRLEIVIWQHQIMDDSLIVKQLQYVKLNVSKHLFIYFSKHFERSEIPYHPYTMEPNGKLSDGIDGMDGDACRLCFSTENVQLMNIFSVIGIELNIGEVISKHFKCEVNETISGKFFECHY